jgi:hypothetical protein
MVPATLPAVVDDVVEASSDAAVATGRAVLEGWCLADLDWRSKVNLTEVYVWRVAIGAVGCVAGFRHFAWWAPSSRRSGFGVLVLTLM